MLLNFSKSIQFLPYIHLARLHRPIGIWLLLWPCFIGLAICRGSFFDYLLFFLGAIITRSAGCVINDIIDVDFDKKVIRTKSRPLASNQITKKQAYIEAFLLLTLSGCLWIFLNKSAKFLSLIALCMLAIYPFMKRFTYLPQVFLGFTFNIGLPIAIMHTSNLTFSWRLINLFFSLILWTIFYDSIYAFADLKDDFKIGIKSTAIIMRKSPKLWLSLINILLHMLLFTSNGFFAAFVGACFLQTLLIQWNPHDLDNCIKTFTYCHFWGLMEWLWLEFVRIITP
ncbi:MAG: 4-hydroxybenzoate octaprenyltransferase [Pseudomonadota bacterium]|jgi:4-hydroxybenzoate polyprenyltransferase|nr:4-hydroxybenzoate octaprenyltransferase [Alphaproteobacteria bacterium]